SRRGTPGDARATRRGERAPARVRPERASLGGRSPPGARVTITDVGGIRVGHLTDPPSATGCTGVVCPPATLGSVEVRGGAPGAHETDGLRPGTLGREVHAVLLTGGSAFGLAAARGVQRWLEERGVGFAAGPAIVPIVPAAVLFDLGVGDPSVR